MVCIYIFYIESGKRKLGLFSMAKTFEIIKMEVMPFGVHQKVQIHKHFITHLNFT